MSYSQVTMNAFARSLKKLMLTQPLHKITIQQLTGDCGVPRHTFYNHFQDIYELLVNGSSKTIPTTRNDLVMVNKKILDNYRRWGIVLRSWRELTN